MAGWVPAMPSYLGMGIAKLLCATTSIPYFGRVVVIGA